MATETEPWAQVNKRPPFTDRRDSSVIAKLAPGGSPTYRDCAAVSSPELRFLR
jgi:hypothetical protein